MSEIQKTRSKILGILRSEQYVDPKLGVPLETPDEEHVQGYNEETESTLLVNLRAKLIVLMRDRSVASQKLKERLGKRTDIHVLLRGRIISQEASSMDAASRVVRTFIKWDKEFSP